VFCSEVVDGTVPGVAAPGFVELGFEGLDGLADVEDPVAPVAVFGDVLWELAA
jgi:hypothetical protein